ncbi:hypothetical protein Q8F55_006504 [Vanrija albida]|uniref:Major facilitator superfamily (MFS) profile domain-containing protein n=1 Tax=Vanrija albida TaxID=181172 RepID=A0ABR3PXC7_9TREE
MPFLNLGSKATHPPDRAHIPSFDDLGVVLNPDAVELAHDPEALANAIGGNGVKDLFASPVVFISSVAACLGALLFGMDLGILQLTLTMTQFKDQFPQSDPDQDPHGNLNRGVMVGLLELGAFFGALAAGYVADRYSRKTSILIGSLWFIVGSILQTASYSFAMLVVGRFVGGIGVGMLSSTAPTYISELAPPNIRGALLVLEYITYGSRYIKNDWSFRAPFALQMLPCVLLLACLVKLPYSPRWLCQAGRDVEALNTLSRLRGLPTSDARVQAEWIQIRAQSIRNREVLVGAHPKLENSPLRLELAAWGDMFKPGVIQRTYIGIMLQLCQQFMGITAILLYTPLLFSMLGMDYEMQLHLSGAINLTQLLAISLPIFYLDKVGRKPPLLLSGIGMAICQYIVGALVARFSNDWAGNKMAAHAGVAFIYIYILVYGCGWGPIPWALPAEVHSSARRAKGVALTTCTNWFGTFIIGVITPVMMDSIGFGTFLFFASVATLAQVWVYFCVPETKGVTLEQMDKLFHSHSSVEDAQNVEQLIGMICNDRHSANGSSDDLKGEETRVEKIA